MTETEQRLSEAKALLRRQDVAAAAALCRQVLAEAPGAAEALLVFGSALAMSRDAAGAAAILRLALALRPDDAATMNALAVALRESGGADEACRLAEAAAARVPDQPEFRRGLATACLVAGRREQAEEAFARLAAMGALLPRDGYNRVENLFRLRRLAEAAAAARLTACLAPGEAEAWHRLGVVAINAGDVRQAVAAYRRAVDADPGHSEAVIDLAAVHKRCGNPALAVQLCRALIASGGERLPEAHAVLGSALSALGNAGEAMAPYETAESLRPDPIAGSNGLLHRCYVDGLDAGAAFAGYRRWNERYAATLAPRGIRFVNRPAPERRLRVGYVSPDFCAHSCYFFLIPLYENHDPAAVEVFSYASLERADVFTAEFQKAGHAWRDISRLSDADAADLVRRDEIDILVDLAGHTAHNRLLLFAREPAPVQVTWLGYPTTTGLDAIDWRLSDSWLTPPDTTERFSERLYRLERPSHCYRPFARAPEVAPPPLERNGFVTFGSANNFAKLSDACLRLWAAALAAVPGARLRLKSRNLPSDESREFLFRRFEAAGGDPGRLDLASGSEQMADHLAQYHEVDIALDSYPYGGMTTTCEALHMGVPVLTLAGDRTSARYAAAVLAAVGLDDLVARTPAEFAAIAARLAGDHERLRTLRAGMRARLAASPLRDEAGFARAVEAAYRDMWGQWCATR